MELSYFLAFLFLIFAVINGYGFFRSLNKHLKNRKGQEPIPNFSKNNGSQGDSTQEFEKKLPDHSDKTSYFELNDNCPGCGKKLSKEFSTCPECGLAIK